MENISSSCVVCNSTAITDMPAFRHLLRVTSDSRAWFDNGQIGFCEHCGAVQKNYDNQFKAEVTEIYDQYNLYFQGRGAEQKIFKNAIGRSRSDVLVDFFLEKIDASVLKACASWLDLGCGMGHLLSNLSSRQLGLRLFGADISEKNRHLIERIDGVLSYFGNGIDGIKQQFDFISLSHVLEHVPSPVSFLTDVRERLTPKGYVLIAVPNWKRNPFDLLIADHCIHFSNIDLARCVRKAGFQVVALSEEYVTKELILVAKVSEIAPNHFDEDSHTIENKYLLQQTITWLLELVSWARANCDKPNVGLFGTALAATWLDSVCRSSFAFFSDEDADRSDTTYLDRPVFSPKDIPVSAKILVPLPNPIAQQVCARLNRLEKGEFCPPPEMV